MPRIASNRDVDSLVFVDFALARLDKLGAIDREVFVENLRELLSEDD